MALKKKLVSAQDITKKLNVSYQTVNSYTDLGLLSVITRNRRRRMYDYRQVARRISEIQRLIGEGYTLRLISRKLNGGARSR